MNTLKLDFKYLVMLYLKSNVHIKVDCKFVVIMHYAFHIILIIGKGLTLVSVLSYYYYIKLTFKRVEARNCYS